MQHNLKIGAQFGRNENVGVGNFLKICESQVIASCFPTSPLEEFAVNLLSTKLHDTVDDVISSFHPSSGISVHLGRWNSVFNNVDPNRDVIEFHILEEQRKRKSIRSYFIGLRERRPKCVTDSRDFFTALNVNPQFEKSSSLSKDEWEVLQLVRRAQIQQNADWSDDVLVTTIMYNLAVTGVDSAHLKLCKRSTVVIAKYVNAVNASLARSKTADGEMVAASSLFSFYENKQTTEMKEANPNEMALLQQLFHLVRESNWIKKSDRIEAFLRVYSFATSVIEDIHPKPRETLVKRWKAILKTHNAHNKGLKIVLKRDATANEFVNDNGEFAFDDEYKVVTGNENGTTADEFVNDNSGFAYDEYEVVTANENGNVATKEGETNANADASVNDDPVLRGDPPIGTDCNVKESIILALKEIGIHNHEEVIAKLTNIYTPVKTGNFTVSLQGPEFVSDAHRQFLQQLDTALGRHAAGKWRFIYKIFKLLYPYSRKSANAVRCMIRHTEKQRKVPLPQSKQSADLDCLPPPTKRQRRSCEMCIKSKTKCGPGTTNPRCTRRSNPKGQQQIHSFLS